MSPREHEDGMRHEPTLSADEKADGFAAVMKRLKSHSPDERARLQSQAEAVALGHEAYALGQEYLDRGDFEAARRWLRVAAGHHIPGAAQTLEEIALRETFDGFTDIATAGGDHAPAGIVPCGTIPSSLRLLTKDGQHRVGDLAWISFVKQLSLDEAVAAARQRAGQITAQAKREADAILAEARQQAERTAAACAHIVLETKQERAEAAASLAEARQKVDGLQTACTKIMLKAEQDSREAAELLTKARQLSESVQSEAAEIAEKAQRRAQETLAQARGQALLIIDDARKGAAQIRRKTRLRASGPETAHTQPRWDLLWHVEEALKLTQCMHTPAGYGVGGMDRGIVERSARRLPVPARPGQNALAALTQVALAGTVVLCVEGKDDSRIVRWMRASQERDGQGCAGPESWSGSWQWLVIETAGCGVSADAFERAGRAEGDVVVVRQDGTAILAIGVMSTGE
ncbi:hypothetical protein ACFTWN_33155 [Streptomyces sp. NPDC057092]|uniref:hypothetical protein n=1 Tax=Streptomyces sp. NPDC057092 TaxID=3346017 RepID=UPI00363F4351